MRLRKNVYFWHRWIALVVSLQLLAWSLGGFVFSVCDIDDVRGTTDASEKSPGTLSLETIAVSAADASRAAAQSGAAGGPSTSPSCRNHPGRSEATCGSRCKGR